MDRALKLAKVAALLAGAFAFLGIGYAALRVTTAVEKVGASVEQASLDVHATAITAQGRLYKIDPILKKAALTADKATAALEQQRLAAVKLNHLADALNDQQSGVPALLVKAAKVEDAALTNQNNANDTMLAARNLLESDDIRGTIANGTVAMRNVVRLTEKAEPMLDKADSILRHSDNIFANGDKKVDQFVNPTKKQRILQGLRDAGHWATVVLRMLF